MASCSAGLSNVIEVRETLRKIQKSLECPICLDLLSDPYTTHCSHPFCRTCIYRVISANKDAKCPLCKETITKRSMNENTRLGEIVEAVKDLEQAIVRDSGTPSTPPRSYSVDHTHEATGTPGMIIHSLVHPTPLKPHPSCLESNNTAQTTTDISLGTSHAGPSIRATTQGGLDTNQRIASSSPKQTTSPNTKVSGHSLEQDKGTRTLRRKRKVRFKSSVKKAQRESVCPSSQYRRELLEALEEGTLRERREELPQGDDSISTSNLVSEHIGREDVVCQPLDKSHDNHMTLSNFEGESIHDPGPKVIEVAPTDTQTRVSPRTSVAETPSVVRGSEPSLVVVQETPFIRVPENGSQQVQGEAPFSSDVIERANAACNLTQDTTDPNVGNLPQETIISSNLTQDTNYPCNHSQPHDETILARETQFLSPPSTDPDIIAPTQELTVDDTQPTHINTDTEESLDETSTILGEDGVGHLTISLPVVQHTREDQLAPHDTPKFTAITPTPFSDENTSDSKIFIDDVENASGGVSMATSLVCCDEFSSPVIPLQNTVCVQEMEDLGRECPVGTVTMTTISETQFSTSVPPSQTTPLMTSSAVLPGLKPSIHHNCLNHQQNQSTEIIHSTYTSPSSSVNPVFSPTSGYSMSSSEKSGPSPVGEASLLSPEMSTSSEKSGPSPVGEASLLSPEMSTSSEKSGPSPVGEASLLSPEMSTSSEKSGPSPVGEASLLSPEMSTQELEALRVEMVQKQREVDELEAVLLQEQMLNQHSKSPHKSLTNTPQVSPHLSPPLCCTVADSHTEGPIETIPESTNVSHTGLTHHTTSEISQTSKSPNSPFVIPESLSCVETDVSAVIAAADEALRKLRSPPPALIEELSVMEVDNDLLASEKSTGGGSHMPGRKSNRIGHRGSGLVKTENHSRIKRKSPPTKSSAVYTPLVLDGRKRERTEVKGENHKSKEPPLKRIKTTSESDDVTRLVELNSDDLEVYSLPSPNDPLSEHHPFMSVTTNRDKSLSVLRTVGQSSTAQGPYITTPPCIADIPNTTTPPCIVDAELANPSYNMNNTQETGLISRTDESNTLSISGDSTTRPPVMKSTPCMDSIMQPSTKAQRGTLKIVRQDPPKAVCTPTHQRVSGRLKVVQTPSLRLSGVFRSPGGEPRTTLSLVGSGLSKIQLRESQLLARKHGGRIASVFNCNTTHVIVLTDTQGLCPRTVKYLLGVVTGVWVVSYQWVEDSLKEERLLSEEAFEVKGDSTLVDGSNAIPIKARLSKANEEPGLFADLAFHLHGDFSGLSKDQLSQLITLGGGVVIHSLTDPPPQVKNVLVVCDDETSALRNSYQIVNSVWILDCVSNYHCFR